MYRKIVMDSPIFFIESFQNDFYAGNIANLTKLFSVDFLQHLTFYYSGMKSAIDHQDELFKMTSRIDELMAKDSNKYAEIAKQREGLKHVLRGYLGPCLYSRRVLLTNLKKAFKKDPAELAYINVLPEHEEWWDKWKKD